MTDSDEELSAARLGRTVGGRWLLESVLGIGGMATVYAARNASGAVAAIKILHPEMGIRREIRERFLREGYVANRIGHPGVVQALEHGETGDEVYLAMELLGGETLRARVKRHGQLPIGEVLDYADQILDVLALAHEKGVVHRDLKPDNLFVSNEGRIKILDFGLARVLDGVPAEHRTRTGVALGTLAYMAPEQALGRRAEIDGRVDIFALGATMFRVLTGRRVHEAESEAELLMAMASRPAPPLAAMLPSIAPAVAGVVDLALAFSRDARYPDARTMQGDVRALRQGQPGPYASARLSSREEATRADRAPMTSQRTQPLAVTMPSHLPGPSSTVPMPVFAAGAVRADPGYGDVVQTQQPPMSVRTEPLAAHPVALPGPGAFASTMPSTQPPVAVPFAQSSSGAVPPVAASAAEPGRSAARGSLALVLVLVGTAVALAGGAGAWYYLTRSDADASSVSAAGAPAAARFDAPAVTGALPVVPAPPGAESAEVAGARPDPKSPAMKEEGAPVAPSASPSPAAAPSVSATASASAVAPPPAPAPSASAAPTSPASPVAPAPTVAPVPPSPPASGQGAPVAPLKRGRGRGKNG